MQHRYVEGELNVIHLEKANTFVQRFFANVLVKDNLVEIKQLNIDSSITDKKTDIIITKISVLDKY